MRFFPAASLLSTLAIAVAVASVTPAAQPVEGPAAHPAAAPAAPFASLPASARGRGHEGQRIFRYDTFGDEQLWTDVLRLHAVIPGVAPVTALAVGLKVDVEALPPAIVGALWRGEVDLTDPAITVALLGLDAVVGVRGTVDETGTLTSLG